MAFDSQEFQGMFSGNYNAFIYEDLSTIIVVEKNTILTAKYST